MFNIQSLSQFSLNNRPISPSLCQTTTLGQNNNRREILQYTLFMIRKYTTACWPLVLPLLRRPLSTFSTNPQPTQIAKLNAEYEHGIFRQKVRTVKDRYGIHTLTNIEYLCSLVRSKKYSLTLNEHILLFYRLMQVFQLQNKNNYFFMEFDELRQRIIGMFQDPEDFACLGTFALTLDKLGIYHSETWINICDFVMQRKYDDEYDQLYALVIAFKNVKQKVQNDWVRERVVQLYRQFLEVLSLHIKQRKYNLKEMRSLIFCLHKYGINEGYFWEDIYYWFHSYIGKLEQMQMEEFFIVNQGKVERSMFDDIIRPVSLLEELTEIAYVLANRGFYCLQFLMFTQKLLSFAMSNGSQVWRKYKVIKQEFQSKQQATASEDKKVDPANPQLTKPYSMLFINAIEIRNESNIQFLYTIKKIQQNHPQYRAEPFMSAWMAKQCAKQYNQYNLREVMILHECRMYLGFSEPEIQRLIELKVSNLRDMDSTIEDIQAIFQLLGKNKLYLVEPLLIQFVKTKHPAAIYQLTKYFVEQNYLPYVPSYFLTLPTVVNSHHKYYSFDENCYFYYVMLTNDVYWRSMNTLVYEAEMEKLKETIKIAAFSRGFTMKIDSYFHKLLEHVNLADFFEGGN